jgi:hypothetical protein
MFSAANLVAVVGWVLLIAAPRSQRAIALAGTAIPLALSATYLGLLARHVGESRGGFSSLQGVADLFANPWLLLAGWVHYLAFDLFVGAWETRDAMLRAIPRWLLIPCLALTFMLGPIGFLAYSTARAWAARRSTSNAQLAR